MKKFEHKKKLVMKSGKVKSVDFHPTFPWVLVGFYSGSITIYDYNTQAALHYLEVTTQNPIRTAKFIAEKNWFVVGADDKKIRVYNYNTLEKVKEFEAHADYIRSIIVHPKEPWIISCSDDQTICLWDYEKNFSLVRTYDEHKLYIMKLAINPKDYNMFASASMDHKIKIWSFTSNNSQMTLEGHSKGANTVTFCPLYDKPYLASGSDDHTIKIWDYSNRQCVSTFEGHYENIASLCFHPELPLLISSSEDHTCKFWNINVFKLEESKLFGYETVWDIAAEPNQNMIAMGCEEGIIVMRMGSDAPLASFNNTTSQAKIVYAKQNAIYSINLKTLPSDIKDGDVIDVQPKSLGSTELSPVTLKFSPNGKYFAVLSEKEFVISTSGVYRSSCVGTCSDLAWNDAGDFVIKEGSSIKFYKNLKETKSFRPGFSFETVFDGPYICIKTLDAVFIYSDSESTIFLRKIDVTPNTIVWNENKKNLALICEDTTYILNVNQDKIDKFVEDRESDGAKEEDDTGCEEGFEPNYEINDKVISGLFVDDVFLYLNSKNKINYAIEDKIFPVTTLNSNYTLLGYLSASNKIYLMNKSHNLISYTFPLSFVNYQMAIMKKDFKLAEKLFSAIPSEYTDRVTNFLEKFEYHELSYDICQNPNQKFALAIKLKKLKDAKFLALEQNNPDKWKVFADLAFEMGEYRQAEEAMAAAKDYQGLLLYYSLINEKEGIFILAENALRDGFHNIAFSCFFQLNEVEKCLDILVQSSRYPEAAVFCRTYCPSKLQSVLDHWNEQINNDNNSRISIKVINPIDNYEESKILEMERVVSEYYDIVKDSGIKDQEKVSSFNDFDLESFLNETKSLNINLKSHLGLD